MKRAVVLCLSIIAIISMMFLFVACDNVNGTQQNKGYTLDFNTVYALAEENGYTGTLDELIEMFKGENAYQLAVAAGYKGTQEEWLMSLSGAAGKDGITPHIGENKHWYLGDVDTGVVAEGKDGKDGKDGNDGRDGNGIERIEKTDSVDLVDTYTIYFTDGTSTTFEISNGADGKDGLNIVSAKYNDNQELMITLSDGTVLNAGRVDGTHVHAFGEWVVVTPATCTTNGVEERSCACGEKETRTLWYADHTWGDWETTQPASCTSKGIQVRTCSVCQATQQQYIPSNGHSYGEWTIVTAATCTENGMQYRVCSVCNAVERQTLVAAGHQGEWQTVREPKCLTDGLRTVTCAVCGQTGSETIHALGHTDSEWVVEKEPSCSVGVKRYRCERCNYTVCEAIPADLTKQHNYVDEVCTVCGEHKGTEGLQYQINGNTARVVGYTGADTDIYISSMFAGALVTDIGTAFRGNTAIRSVTIPYSVTSIRDYAFYTCSGLTSVTIPDSVTSIWSGAFYGCSGLTSITIPSSVTSIGNGTFSGCSGLTSINYKGTKAQWNAISKGNYWNGSTGNYMIHCTDGDISKT